MQTIPMDRLKRIKNSRNTPKKLNTTKFSLHDQSNGGFSASIMLSSQLQNRNWTTTKLSKCSLSFFARLHYLRCVTTGFFTLFKCRETKSQQKGFILSTWVRLQSLKMKFTRAVVSCLKGFSLLWIILWMVGVHKLQGNVFHLALAKYVTQERKLWSWVKRLKYSAIYVGWNLRVSCRKSMHAFSKYFANET